MTEKEKAIKLIEGLPETATTRDIMYELYVRSVLAKSMTQLEAGQVIPHEEVKKEISRWLRK